MKAVKLAQLLFEIRFGDRSRSGILPAEVDSGVFEHAAGHAAPRLEVFAGLLGIELEAAPGDAARADRTQQPAADEKPHSNEEGKEYHHHIGKVAGCN